MHMNIQLISTICTNSLERGSINKAMSKCFWSRIKVTWSLRKDKCLSINLDELALSSYRAIEKVVVYYPESQRKSTHRVTSTTKEIQLLPGNDRYLNLLLLDIDGFIRYSNTVLIGSDPISFIDDRKLASRTRATLTNFDLCRSELFLELELEETIGTAFAVLQTINEAIDIPVALDAQKISIHHCFDKKMKPEIWMLCIGDADNAYLSQLCLKVDYENK